MLIFANIYAYIYSYIIYYIYICPCVRGSGWGCTFAHLSNKYNWYMPLIDFDVICHFSTCCENVIRAPTACVWRINSATHSCLECLGVPGTVSEGLPSVTLVY